jgi:two-component system phosphate regulon sensor histidine kinase PhoR
VRADQERIQRVLINLLSNAIKFTDPGGAIEVRVDAPRSGRVPIRVKDSGCGIPEQFKSNLFKRFSQAPRQNKGGTGLGLAIVKGILDAHGSQVQIESREGRGTQVTFDLEEVSDGSADHHGD